MIVMMMMMMMIELKGYDDESMCRSCVVWSLC